MAEPIHFHQDAQHDAPRGHEARDLSIRGICIFFIGLAVLAAAVHVGMKLALDAMSARESASDPPPSPLTKLLPATPPEPRLQVAPALDLEDFRRAEETELTRYGWLDEAKGVVRIPIERAMDLTLERGLPARKP